ncbi:MAG: thioredoxin-dependent thiol peroxidase [Snowella sp.]|nr:MAG: thioredoxin-dependent thiol peroxidase [Snowella sp.]
MSQLPAIGQPAPAFSATNQDDKTLTLLDFQGSWLILYFYPKDNTPGCTTEAIDFSQKQAEWENLNVKVLGVSPDSVKSHCKFIEKHSLTVQLLSDPDHEVAESYGVWGLKKFMGKEYMGIIRSTFLIDPSGNIAYVWPSVKVKGHVESVLAKVKELA